jgi:hypothetical protein
MAKGFDRVQKAAGERALKIARARTARQIERDVEDMRDGLIRCDICGDYHDPTEEYYLGEPHKHDGSYY